MWATNGGTMNKLISLIVAGVLSSVVFVSGAAAQGNGAVILRADLSGAEEVPPVETDASGTAKLRINPGSDEIHFQLKVSNGVDLLAVAGAHIHCAPAGANGPVVAFLAAPVDGGVDGKLMVSGTITDADIVNDACGATVDELVASMQDGNTYVNVHSAANPSGEVRGQIT